ncbi:MAG: transporter [Chitinivibrionales bacterium]|nr:transporter [Chitinivibrionales bacterium]
MRFKKLRHSLRRFLRKNSGVKIALFFICVILLSSCVVFLIERNHNDGFVSFFDSFWWTIVTISTVGYGDRLPASVHGRLVAVVIIFFGVAMMGTVTGRIASFLMERQMKEEQGLLDYRHLKRHFLICGWKREMNHILHEVLKSNNRFDPTEVVLINKAPTEEINALRSEERFSGIKFINGDFIEERDLVRAGVKGAAKALVLADYLTKGDLQQIDSKTVMAVMSIKNLNKKAYVCAELLDTKFEKYLKLSQCDEVLLSRRFSRSMLASASAGTGLSHVIRTLIAEDTGAQITTLHFPDSFIGKEYGTLADYYRDKQHSLLIGLLENTGNLVSRKREALREAQKNPDISKLIPDLRSVKNLTANDPVINPRHDYLIKKYSRGIVITGTTIECTGRQPA